MQVSAAPAVWKACSLGEVIARVVGGGTPPRDVPAYWIGAIPWASVKDFKDDVSVLHDTEEHISPTGLGSSAANLIEAGVPLVCTRMAVGRTAISDRPLAINQDIKALYPKSQLTAKFLLLLLEFGRPQLESQSIGSTVKGISVQQLLNIPVMLPPVPEQRRIADILDTADAVIQQTEALIAKLKQQKSGLLHDLLTRGLDERGQLRNPIAHPEQFKDSPLGRIPREWEVFELGSSASLITSGSRGWAAYYSEDGPLFLRIGNLTREHLNLRLADLVHVRPPGGGEGSRTAVQAGDILISITADLGMVGVIPDCFGEAYVNQHIALIRLDQARAKPRWVGNYLAGAVGQKQFYRLNDAGAKAGLNLPTVSRLLIALPKVHEQERIGTIIDAHDARIRAEEAYRDKLKLQKQGLMQDLLTGRVRVDAVERVMA